MYTDNETIVSRRGRNHLTRAHHTQTRQQQRREDEKTFRKIEFPSQHAYIIVESKRERYDRGPSLPRLFLYFESQILVPSLHLPFSLSACAAEGPTRICIPEERGRFFDGRAASLFPLKRARGRPSGVRRNRGCSSPISFLFLFRFFYFCSVFSPVPRAAESGRSIVVS